jgi:TatD DNase family protein
MAEAASAIARAGRYGEIVFCGYGEPTCRVNDVLEAARALKSLGLPLRLDTNGHGNMINRRDIVPELAEVFDGVSVSLNAHDRASYAKLCRPDAGEKAFDAVIDFLKRAAASRMACTVTVLDYPGVDVEACRALVATIPRARFRVRTYYME